MGTDLYAAGLSLSTILAPTYIAAIPVPKLLDRVGSYNNLPGVPYDESTASLMALTPPKDVIIVLGPADYTDSLMSPYAYDNTTGLVYYPNGNYDVGGNYFYNW